MSFDLFNISTSQDDIPAKTYELFFNAMSSKDVEVKKQGEPSEPQRSNAEWYAENLSGSNASQWELGIKNVKDMSAEPGHGDLLFIICLSDKESSELTLGKPKRLGGDFTEDRMFCMDIDTFFQTYKHIPQRVSDMLMRLDGYVPNKSKRRFRSSSEGGFEIL